MEDSKVPIKRACVVVSSAGFADAQSIERLKSFGYEIKEIDTNVDLLLSSFNSQDIVLLSCNSLWTEKYSSKSLLKYLSTSCIDECINNFIQECIMSASGPTVIMSSDSLRLILESLYLKNRISLSLHSQNRAIALAYYAKINEYLSLAIQEPNYPRYGINKRVLLLGSGGREHAIAHKLSSSLAISRLYVAPGNGGTSSIDNLKVCNVSLDISKMDAIEAFVKNEKIDLVVVGPEQPLVDGVVDTLEQIGVPCFGPSSAAAIIEASKAWSKDFMTRYGILTAAYKNFTDTSAAKSYLHSISHKVVVKASGLAAGKGVIIPVNTEEAVAAVDYIMSDNAFGDAGAEVVIEEFLEGEEVSVLAFTDGKTVVTMPGAQDHKRVGDGDTGLNTGGMGAYAPAPILTPALERKCSRILQTVIDGMAMEGKPYKGVLYGGFMIPKASNSEPIVLEFNCRFGDPETQVLLPLLENDLFEVCMACAVGTLADIDVKWKRDTFACTVVCAAGGYPEAYEKGKVIIGLDKVPTNATVYHAGTISAGNGTVCTNGGRVLAVTGLGSTLKEAVCNSYAALKSISFEGMHFRRDIALRGINAPLRLGVLGSTRGSSLQPIIDAIEDESLPNTKIAVVISNKADAPILERACKHSIKSVHIPCPKGTAREAYDKEVIEVLESEAVDIVLLIGYMRIVSSSFTNRWKGRCINVHPSLLPDFAGGMDLQVHAAVIEKKKIVSGCTVHLVTDVVDGGEIIVQETCPVLPDDTPETLKARVQPLEGLAFIKAIKLFATNRSFDSAVKQDPATLTYKDAGVDIDAGDALVKIIGPYCKATRRAGCDAELGGFGGLFDLSQAGYDSNETILVSGTDGVGTKLKIAQGVGIHDTIGIDLVAMCVNDVLVCGAEPLFFLDYYATGHLNVPEAAAVVKGIAEGCALSGSALIGGETAEMAGMYDHGEYDLAGFSVGAVRKSDILPKNVRASDVLIGLRSSGVHSNGYSLVRKCVEASGLSWDAECPFEKSKRLGEALLTPTRIYAKLLLPLVKRGLLKGMAHITGGGLLDNLPRVLPTGIDAFVDPIACAWSLPPVFKWLQSIANLPQNELLRTFNCGIGMVLVVASENKAAVVSALEEAGEKDFYLLGELRANADHEPRVVMLGDVV